MTLLVVLTVVDVALLIAGLAVYLWIVGGQLTRVADLLEECSETVAGIADDAAAVEPGLEHINRTGGVVASALPLLYGMAEGIVAGVGFDPETAHAPRPPAAPASGRRRSRLHDGVGYAPGGETLAGRGTGADRLLRQP